jgi:hypothetical protein
MFGAQFHIAWMLADVSQVLSGRWSRQELPIVPGGVTQTLPVRKVALDLSFEGGKAGSWWNDMSPKQEVEQREYYR